MGRKVGRKRLYDNDETKKLLEELVVQYRKENAAGIVTFTKMAQFSEEMHFKDNVRYPVIYNRFVWAKQGRHLIEKVNTPIRTYSKIDPGKLEIPPISRYVEEYSSNPKKLLSLLLPIEKLIFNLLESEDKKNQYVEMLQKQVEKLKNDIVKLQLLNDSLSSYILDIAVKSNVKRFRQYYGLPEILEYGENSMEGLNDLKNFLYPEDKNDDKQVISKNNTLLTYWDQLRGKGK